MDKELIEAIKNLTTVIGESLYEIRYETKRQTDQLAEIEKRLNEIERAIKY